MVQITEELIRKRAEHNDGILSTLKEVTLHQFDIERIELIGTLCPQLEILYLQNNLIPRIENLRRLKELRYLNVAVNNIKKIENLERCESLEKLDLTCNFVDVDELESIESLSCNTFLKELHMIGNPCTKFDGYRDFVIAVLPRLQILDGREVLRSERISATQALPFIRKCLNEHLASLSVTQPTKELKHTDVTSRQTDQSDISAPAEDTPSGTDVDNGSNIAEPSLTSLDDSQRPTYTDTSEKASNWSPEGRLIDHKKLEALRKEHEDSAKSSRSGTSKSSTESNTQPTASADITPRQKNEGRWPFKVEDDASGENIVVEIGFPKFLDTSLIDVDIHPTYVKAVTKGKTILLTFPDEVISEQCKAQRSKVTGSLVLTLPKTHHVLRPTSKTAAPIQPPFFTKTPAPLSKSSQGSNLQGTVDLRNISSKSVDTRESSFDLLSDLPPLEVA